MFVLPDIPYHITRRLVSESCFNDLHRLRVLFCEDPLFGLVLQNFFTGDGVVLLKSEAFGDLLSWEAGEVTYSGSGGLVCWIH